MPYKVIYPEENKQIFSERGIEPFIPEGTIVEKTFLPFHAPNLVGIRLLEDHGRFKQGEILPASSELVVWFTENFNLESTKSSSVQPESNVVAATGSVGASSKSTKSSLKKI